MKPLKSLAKHKHADDVHTQQTYVCLEFSQESQRIHNPKKEKNNYINYSRSFYGGNN